MNRGERKALRESLARWKPGQHVEMNVARLRSLLDETDRLDQYDPGMHHRIALAHWQHGSAIDGCVCASCEGFRAHERLRAGDRA